MANYIATFPSFQSAQIDKAIIDNEINLESLKNEGHETSFYKNILKINNENVIEEFMNTFEMIFGHSISNNLSSSSPSSPNKVRNSASRQSATTLPKLSSASTANLNQMKQSIVESFTIFYRKIAITI